MSDTFRLVRLVGDGDASGGGLPLPDAFTAVLQELLDHGPATSSALTELMIDTLSFKTKRVMATWKTWPDFTADILDQLADAKLITWAEDDSAIPERRWTLTEKFTPGVRQVIIPEAGIGVIVRRQEERARLNALSRALVDARALESRVSQLRASSEHVEWAQLYLGKAVNALESELALRPVKPARGRPRKDSLPPRPTPEELAREKYGLGGTVPGPLVRNVFREDGTRLCGRCGEPRTPDQYSVYWESGHNHAYFLRGACRICEDKRLSNRSRTRK